MTIFGIFSELLATQNVNVARFARNVECDFFSDFQTLWPSEEDTVASIPVLLACKGNFSEGLAKGHA